MAKNQANAKQHPEAEILLFENFSHFSYTLSSKNNSKCLSLLDLSGLPPSFSANLHVISANLKACCLISGAYQNPVEQLKVVDYLSDLRYLKGSGYGSLFETKKFIVLNSMIKPLKIEQFWARIKVIPLDRPRTKQFSLLGKFSLFFIKKKSHISRTLLKFSQNS